MLGKYRGGIVPPGGVKGNDLSRCVADGADIEHESHLAEIKAGFVHHAGIGGHPAKDIGTLSGSAWN